MFYENQSENQRNDYKKMLEVMGNLTLLFSVNKSPYLHYRCHENIFCKYFEATNIGRKDDSADAKKEKVGIGLKTWVGRDDQKIAEFGGVRPRFENLKGIELVKFIAGYRNERIRVTKNMYDIDVMIYHIVKRVPGYMKIMEHAFDYIDIDSIELIPDRGNENNTYFTDGKHTYHFSASKNTLYMNFSDLEELDCFPVSIMEDPYSYLMDLCSGDANQIECTGTDRKMVDYKINLQQEKEEQSICEENQLCLRLYTIDRTTKEKIVSSSSGLNQWNGIRTSNYKRADGTIVHVESPRDINELYIPYTAQDRKRNPTFFPPKNVPFKLRLPDGTIIDAKVCQDAYKKMPEDRYNLLTDAERKIEDTRRLEGKSIMSNPNKVLGEWLLRKVFEIPKGTIVTYDMLERFGVDSVVFTKLDDFFYTIDFSEIGTYEAFYGDAYEMIDDLAN